MDRTIKNKGLFIMAALFVLIVAGIAATYAVTNNGKNSYDAGKRSGAIVNGTLGKGTGGHGPGMNGCNSTNCTKHDGGNGKQCNMTNGTKAGSMRKTCNETNCTKQGNASKRAEMKMSTEMLEELGLSENATMNEVKIALEEKRNETLAAIEDTIEAKDYDAWKTLVNNTKEGKFLLEKITEENFQDYVEMLGYLEKANEISEDLGLTQDKENDKGLKKGKGLFGPQKEVA